MIREIRKIKIKAKRNYIRQLQWRGKLPVHINDAGYICYDPEELKAYSKTAKRGRPLKIKKEN